MQISRFNENGSNLLKKSNPLNIYLKPLGKIMKKQLYDTEINRLLPKSVRIVQLPS